MSNPPQGQVSTRCVCTCVMSDNVTSPCVKVEFLSFQPEDRDDFIFIKSHRHFWKGRTLPAVSCVMCRIW